MWIVNNSKSRSNLLVASSELRLNILNHQVREPVLLSILYVIICFLFVFFLFFGFCFFFVCCFAFFYLHTQTFHDLQLLKA